MGLHAAFGPILKVPGRNGNNANNALCSSINSGMQMTTCSYGTDLAAVWENFDRDGPLPHAHFRHFPRMDGGKAVGG